VARACPTVVPVVEASQVVAMSTIPRPRARLVDAAHRDGLACCGQSLEPSEVFHEPPRLCAIEARRVELAHDTTQPLDRLADLLEHASSRTGTAHWGKRQEQYTNICSPC
jgi:hypothetical protein